MAGSWYFMIYVITTTPLELHIKEDMAGCLEAIRAQDHQMLDQQASLVRGRCMRLLRVVQCGMAERSNRCTADQLENVNQAVIELRNKGLSVCLFVCSFLCLSVCLYVCLSIHLFFCSLVCLFVCMSVYLISSLQHWQTSLQQQTRYTMTW